MYKYLLDLIGSNSNEPLVDYEDRKLKLSYMNIFQNLAPISLTFLLNKVC